jgi:hypothetical protein
MDAMGVKECGFLLWDEIAVLQEGDNLMIHTVLVCLCIWTIPAGSGKITWLQAIMDSTQQAGKLLSIKIKRIASEKRQEKREKENQLLPQEQVKGKLHSNDEACSLY